MTQPDMPFEAPWQARAFAIVVHLHAQGAFSWGEWTSALGAELARDDTEYWSAWLRALEGILLARGLAGRTEVLLGSTS